MRIAMTVPAPVDRQALRDRLEQVAGELCVEIGLADRH
jgi:glycine cleavage system regulatory protein